MSAISEDLARIDAAVYGEEVRSSIHHAIEQCYTDVTTAETLANTAANNANNKAGLADTAATRANQAAATAENLTGIVAPAFVEATANDAGTYVTNNGGLYYLPDGHTANVTWANTIKVSVNAMGEVTDLKSAIKAIEPKWITGSYVSNFGAIVTSSVRIRSDYIPCYEGITVKYYGETNHSGVSALTFYDANKNVLATNSNIGAVNTEYTAVAPQNTAFVIVSGYIGWKTQINFVSSPFYPIINDNIININQSIKDINTSNYKINNLMNDVYNKNDIAYQVTPSRYIATDGSINTASYSTNRITSNIQAKEGDIFYISGSFAPENSRLSVAFYNSSNTYIPGSGLNLATITGATEVDSYEIICPANTKYFVVGYVYSNGSQGFSKDIRILKNTPINACYVAYDGNDNNDGRTADTPFATFQHAINLGFTKLIVKRGAYTETINKNGDLEIVPYDRSESFVNTNPNRQKIVITNGTALENLTESSGILSQAFSGNTRMQAVFIDQTTPISSGTGARAYYNAGLVQVGTDDSDTSALEPVLSLASCEATAGSFYWNGTTIYINPANYTYSAFVIVGDADECIKVLNAAKVHLEDVACMYGFKRNISIIKSTNTTLFNCYSYWTQSENGIITEYSNANHFNCESYHAKADGMGSQYYGTANYFNCKASYCGDDGISHHNGNTGYIQGGEFSYCGKGGVASPTWGAIYDVDGVYTHHNNYGLYAESGSQYPMRKFRWSNCLIANNNNDLYCRGDNIEAIGWNNIFSGNTQNGRTSPVNHYTEFTND